MRYFVIGEDGQLYGPADVATLNEWIAQGRLAPTSMIMEELGGARFAASLLKELNFPSNYPRIHGATTVQPGESEVKIAWILGVVGLVCCSLCGPIGLVYGIFAKRKGHPKAVGPIVFCAIVTAVSILWTIYYVSVGGLEGILRNIS